MLPVTKKSKSAKRKRRTHHVIHPANLVPCPKCGNSKLPHAACGGCGYVSSQVVLQRGGKAG